MRVGYHYFERVQVQIRNANTKRTDSHPETRAPLNPGADGNWLGLVSAFTIQLFRQVLPLRLRV